MPIQIQIRTVRIQPGTPTLIHVEKSKKKMKFYLQQYQSQMFYLSVNVIGVI
jgi:hypothetical protein